MSLTLGDGSNDVALGGNNNTIKLVSGDDNVDLGQGTGHLVSLGNGNGNGNDTVTGST